MLKFHVLRGATVAGVVLVAMSILDLLGEGGAPGFSHYGVAALGFALLAVAGAAGAGR